MEGVGRRHCSARLPSPSRGRYCLIITAFYVPSQGKKAFSLRPSSVTTFLPSYDFLSMPVHPLPMPT